MDYSKSQYEEGFDADDFTSINFTNIPQAYVIGTAAYVSDPAGLAALIYNPDTALRGFTAQKVLFYATQNCLVRFNGPLRVQHLLLAGAYYTFKRKVTVIYVVRQTVNGTLYVHALG